MKKKRANPPSALEIALDRAMQEAWYAFDQIEKDVTAMRKMLQKGKYREAVQSAGSAAAQSGVLNRALVESEDLMTQMEQQVKTPAELQGAGPHIWKKA